MHWRGVLIHERRNLEQTRGSAFSSAVQRRVPSSALLIILATSTISYPARSATYTITSYPAGLADLPCDAFKKNPDGSWTQVATLIAGGALIPPGNIFKDTAETRIIEKKCYKQ
jgi:hypothetical protein